MDAVGPVVETYRMAPNTDETKRQLAREVAEALRSLDQDALSPIMDALGQIPMRDLQPLVVTPALGVMQRFVPGVGMQFQPIPDPQRLRVQFLRLAS